MKERTLDDHFRDWESDVFGHGYGTGEPHVLAVLKRFFELCDQGDYGGYNHEGLEAALGPAVAWLLINVLVRADIIDYGTSPRYGWLTPQGLALKAYIAERSLEQLEDVVCAFDEHNSPLVGCYRQHCNCGPNGYSATKLCHNPFWTV